MRDRLIGGTTVAATGTTGLAQMMSWIPDDIGKLACLVSMVISIIVIVPTIKRIRLVNKKLRLEIKNMKADKK